MELDTRADAVSGQPETSGSEARQPAGRNVPPPNWDDDENFRKWKGERQAKERELETAIRARDAELERLRVERMDDEERAQYEAQKQLNYIQWLEQQVQEVEYEKEKRAGVEKLSKLSGVDPNELMSYQRMDEAVEHILTKQKQTEEERIAAAVRAVLAQERGERADDVDLGVGLPNRSNTDDRGGKLQRALEERSAEKYIRTIIS